VLKSHLVSLGTPHDRRKVKEIGVADAEPADKVAQVADTEARRIEAVAAQVVVLVAVMTTNSVYGKRF
jgi:hypothetical protein